MNRIIKIIIQTFSVLLILSGVVWALQGLNILPGSVMSGNPQWIINGIICSLIGVGLFWFVHRK